MTEQISTEDARQGRNIKGMVWVLVISIALLVVGYMLMLAFAAKPVTVDNQAIDTPAAATDAAAPNASPPTETQ
jgi:hypothetical protein